MIISELNHLEIVSESINIEGGNLPEDSGSSTFSYTTNNNFAFTITSPSLAVGNYASAGAQGQADNPTCIPTWSYTKADSFARTSLGGASVSYSVSAAAIVPVCF